MKPKRIQAFTLIELLVVITIIAILAGLLFPTLSVVQESARKTQAANDIQAILTATKAYFTDYGKYPLGNTVTTAARDVVYGKPGATNYNDQVISVLRGLAHDGDGNLSAAADSYPLNPRRVTYVEAREARDANAPKVGIATQDKAPDIRKGGWFDPWGSPYLIFGDADYDNQISFDGVYNDQVNGNSVVPRVGVGIASLGKDKKPGKASKTKPDGDKNFAGSDDVVSWR